MMRVLPLSASIRTLHDPLSSLPVCCSSLVVRSGTRTDVSEPPSASARFFPPPALHRLPLGRLRPRRSQPFPLQPGRRLGRPRPGFKALRVFSKPSSASVVASVVRRGKPSVFVVHRAVMRRRPPLVELLLVRTTPERMVVWERRGSSLGFWVHVFPEIVPRFFWTFSEMVAPVHRDSIEL